MMRIISPTGVLYEVATVAPVCEARIEFNGRQQRFIEFAQDTDVKPTGLAMRITSGIGYQQFYPNNQVLFVGNLKPEKVAEIQEVLLAQGYFDFSKLEYQKVKFVGETRFDKGQGKAYSSEHSAGANTGLLFSNLQGFPIDIFAQSPACGCVEPECCEADDSEVDDKEGNDEDSKA